MQSVTERMQLSNQNCYHHHRLIGCLFQHPFFIIGLHDGTELQQLLSAAARNIRTVQPWTDERQLASNI